MDVDTGSRRTALVTGAGRGIGAATARELARRGYHVIVNYRTRESTAQVVVADIRACGGSAELARADVSDPYQVADLVEAVLARHDGIDVLVCNANIHPPFAPFASMPWKDFIDKIDGELAAAFFITQHVLEAMRRRAAGRIVYVSGIAAEGSGGGWIAHATAKGALNAFASQIAAEAARFGIAVNTVMPDSAKPGDVAKVIGSVVDDERHGVNGVALRVDGGLAPLNPLYQLVPGGNAA
jgi:3-oxoacyl-[acyl-carrier protein] reductase